MAGLAPKGSQFDARQFNAKMTKLLATGGAEDFFTSYEEVFDSFDAMGLQENILRGIYAYSFEKPFVIQQRGICQTLVLAPTRELVQQIEKVMRALGDYLGVKVHACVGGTSVHKDQQSLHPDYIKTFVLDEADEMLSRGFKDHVCSMSLLFIPLVGYRFTYLLQSNLHALFSFILF
ncbi:hypothetical protein UlMin_027549 [Ulmus minor]